MYSEDYEKKLKDHFKANKKVYLFAKVGLVNGSLQLVLKGGGATLDLFFSYKHNLTHMKLPYQLERKKFM
jgi:hypothetical protein